MTYLHIDFIHQAMQGILSLFYNCLNFRGNFVLVVTKQCLPEICQPVETGELS